MGVLPAKKVKDRMKTLAKTTVALACVIAGTACSSGTGEHDLNPVDPDQMSQPDQPAGDGTIRPVVDGFVLDDVAMALQAMPSWEAMNLADIEVALNASCDAIAVAGDPLQGVAALESRGIAGFDAAMGVSAAITIYCPEWLQLLQ